MRLLAQMAAGQVKICFLCSEYPPGLHGGAGTFTQVMARALVQCGHQVRVVGVYPRTHPEKAYAVDQGVQVWRICHPGHRFGWLLARYQLYRLVMDWISAAEVELIESPDHEGWFAGWPRWVPVPLVHRAGGSYSYFAHELGLRISRVASQLERWSYRRADAWIAKSRYIGQVTKRLFKLTSGPDATLYNPIEIPPTARAFDQRDSHRVIFAGTLTYKKGITRLIEAWPKVRMSCRAAELHIYGKDGRGPTGGSMMEYLTHVLASELHPTVHFHGHVSRAELTSALSAARVAVFPSYAEGFAWAPLEAMAAGCATVYSCRGSGPELIEDNRHGLLVDPASPDEIAMAVLRILEDARFAQRLGEAGRARVVSAFSLERLLPMNEAFFKEQIEAFRRRT